MNSNSRIIFFGTPQFAVPSLMALVENGWNVVAIVTNPDEPAGRGRVLTPPPVKVAAQKYHIPVFQHVIDGDHLSKELPEADLFIVVAYGKIISRPILELPRLGTLNVHPSLLPRWRGPSPIRFTILNGDTEAGVTIIKLDDLMDHGPIIGNSKFEIQNQKITYSELHDILAKEGARLLLKILPDWISGKIIPEPQNDSAATFTRKLTKDDGRIDWSRPAMVIDRMVRAFNPRPGTWTLHPAKDKIYRLRIERVSIFNETSPEGSAGFVWSDARHPMLVNTGGGSIAVEALTLEGKKSMPADAFVRGYPQLIGTTLI